MRSHTHACPSLSQTYSVIHIHSHIHKHTRKVKFSKVCQKAFTVSSETNLVRYSGKGFLVCFSFPAVSLLRKTGSLSCGFCTVCVMLIVSRRDHLIWTHRNFEVAFSSACFRHPFGVDCSCISPLGLLQKILTTS